MASVFFAALCAPSYRESLVGDLEEEFTQIALHDGVGPAQKWYWNQLFLSVAHLALSRAGTTGQMDQLRGFLVGSAVALFTSFLICWLVHSLIKRADIAQPLLLLSIATTVLYSFLSALAGAWACVSASRNRNYWVLSLLGFVVLVPLLEAVPAIGLPVAATLLAAGAIAASSGIVLGERFFFQLNPLESRL